MKRNAMRKNLRQSIRKSLGRYIAISAIIALGAGLFMGLLMSKADMVATGQKFTDEHNMFDLRMISNYGWSEEYVEQFEALPGVEAAEGQIYLDLIAMVEGEAEAVFRFYSLPEKLNTLALMGGRMPEKNSECLADGYLYDDSILGKKVIIPDTNDEDSLDAVKYRKYTIVGYVSSPLYMDMNRGNTAIGSGTLQNYFYIPEKAFDVDYYTEIDLTLEGSYAIYSDSYAKAVEEAVDALEPAAERLAEQRFRELKEEIEDEYQEGYQEYLDGLQEYEDGKAEAEQELADAQQELLDAQKELDDSYDALIRAGNEIKAGYKTLEQGQAELLQAKAKFKSQKAAAMEQINAKRAEADASASTVEQNYSDAMTAIATAQAAMEAAAVQTNAYAVLDEIKALQGQIGQIQNDQNLSDEEKAAQIQGIAGNISSLQASISSFTAAAANLQAVSAANQQAIMDKYVLDGTYQALAEQEQKLAAGEAEFAAQEERLAQSKAQLDAADEMVMVNWGKWGEGRDELAQGWVDFNEAKLEVAQELADAEAELQDAQEELREARDEIDSMEEPDLFILDRESNVGYTNLDSSSDIVAGVSRVFPVFFLLIAALVCITTMTRMIDEERTQIGTLKALGYSNAAIISKYMIYSGSGAIIGCVLGLLLGCTIFPQIIWKAYGIMLYIQPNIVLTVNWPLAIAIVVCYLSVMLLVTWYCCDKTLREEPAQLIRPKAPEAGKKILMEYLPFWNKLKFLNKVAIRNIFRYRQRLAMMLIGISGCTALLIAGFGLRDSVVNIVDYQFRDITHYDLSVYFREELTEKEFSEFEKTVKSGSEQNMLYHQSSVELDNGEGVKEIYMISGDERLKEYIQLHSGEKALSLPQNGEIVLSIGVAENMGIRVGDRVTVRSADLEEMKLTVSGIYDNYIYNYCIVSPESIQTQWGYAPELQMAFLKVKTGGDVHALSAAITELDTVLNVTVSEDLAEMVGSMMQALDLVVMVAVVSAALLAIIVLYNLTNININERIREIATIKVLGFNASETASYVFKENMVLTIVGAFLGLGLGWLLLIFIMTQVKIDFVWFKAVLTPVSCVLAVVMTLVSAVVVECIFYFKLDKINMAEALKSVE